MGRPKKIKGVGDIIAAITTAVGVEPCEGCNKRKEQLNRLFPFGIEEFTEDEKIYLGTFFEADKSELNKQDQKDILDIYFRVFRVKTFEPCVNCPGVWVSIIKKLKKAYENA
jgi:hypothetical protein